MWINPNTLQVFKLHSEIRSHFNNVSFSNVITEEDIESVGLLPVVQVAKPAFNPITETVQEVTPVLTEGQWFQTWEVTQVSSEISANNLAAAKASQWEAIKAVRDRKLNFGGFKVGTDWFHSDVFSRSQWAIMARKADKIEIQEGNMNQILPNPSGTGDLYWKTMSGSFVGVTPALVQQIVASGETQDATIFQHAEVLRAQVNAASNPYSVNINAGWPETFNNI